jgi:class 3 adenylate cyclase
VLFLDIAQYTKMAAGMAPEVLNSLIETYFAAFFDIIISAGDDINETAGDGIMAIFTGKNQHIHALNAVRAALAIHEQAGALHRDRQPPAPEVLVNIGINTRRVLLGATMIKGAVGERFIYTASGMVTNIAARIYGIGHAGDIHLSETTALLVPIGIGRSLTTSPFHPTRHTAPYHGGSVWSHVVVSTQRLSEK